MKPPDAEQQQETRCHPTAPVYRRQPMHPLQSRLLHILRRAAFRAQCGAVAYQQVQHGQQQPRDEERGNQRQLHRVRQFAEETARQTAHQAEREMDNNGRERRCHHRGKEVAYRVLHRPETVERGVFLVFAVNLLDDDDGIVDNQPHRCRHRAERHHVDHYPRQIAEQDTQRHCHGYGQHHHRAGTLRAQEHHHHQQGEKQPLEDGAQYAVDAVAHKRALVVVRL